MTYPHFCYGDCACGWEPDPSELSCDTFEHFYEDEDEG